MRGKWPWFERPFTFDYPPEKFPDILERLRGTPVRVEALVRDVSKDVLTRCDGETWSIQENVGHLADVEPLWTGRIDDMLASAELMREADLKNAATFAAGHNDRTIGEVLASLREVRGELVRRLESLSNAEVALTSIHPRTKIRMRVCDLCTFVAEHDDYHLARITHLKRHFISRSEREPTSP